MSGQRKLLSTSQSVLDRLNRHLPLLVPARDEGNHAAGVEQKRWHQRSFERKTLPLNVLAGLLDHFVRHCGNVDEWYRDQPATLAHQLHRQMAGLDLDDPMA